MAIDVPVSDIDIAQTAPFFQSHQVRLAISTTHHGYSSKKLIDP
ncbi:hypothetical protein [Aquabacterium sp. A08]|nr:hypothetical protein [Aquabacterium sp. A08]